MPPKGVVLIGATGSIGTNTLRVIEAHPDKLRLVGAANNTQSDKLEAIGRRFGALRTHCVERDGPAALADLATMPEADIVVMAAGGTACLAPTLAAIEARKTIALASKEVLVMAGSFVTEAARRNNVRILPVDSEHNAIFQCLEGHPRDSVRRLILTASGGPFRNATPQQLAAATPEQALRHPNWNMGPKITIDSATMANKGLEMMEARWLFDVEPRQISVVVHPQSIIHSMVEFVDGAILAQLAPPSMTFAIQHALLHPERRPGVDERLDLTHPLSLDFAPPDEERFKTLKLARQAMETGGASEAIYNAANEVAVQAFIHRQIPFLAIAEIIGQTLANMPVRTPGTIAELVQIDKDARDVATAITQNEFLRHI
jgi:1-deoxy-D-xylulose-5-phosphate reductoisomerase